jgi:hypothetical protein
MLHYFSWAVSISSSLGLPYECFFVVIALEGWPHSRLFVKCVKLKLDRVLSWNYSVDKKNHTALPSQSIEMISFAKFIHFHSDLMMILASWLKSRLMLAKIDIGLKKYDNIFIPTKSMCMTISSYNSVVSSSVFSLSVFLCLYQGCDLYKRVTIVNIKEFWQVILPVITQCVV